MKHLLILSFLLTVLTGHGQSFFESADAFFGKYVENGRVDYKAINKSPAGLNSLVDQIANLDLTNKRVTADYMKAFYVNAYNILVIRQVVDLYPIDGPLKVDGFFDKVSHQVMGEPMTLNQLEKEVLYKRFPDPRLHFVLVCAAKGCPPLADFAYQPDTFEKQLEKRTRYVLNLEWFIRVDESVAELSQIFNWYSGDFKKTETSIISYINKYRQDKISRDKKISYYEYDWSLNE